MQAGCDITLWHLSEARRFFGELAVKPEILDAGKLEKWLIEQGSKSVSTRDIQRCGPNRIREKTKFDAAMGILTEYGRAQVVEIGKKKLVYLNPEVL